mgnify:CR=1 FL=1
MLLSVSHIKKSFNDYLKSDEKLVNIFNKYDLNLTLTENDTEFRFQKVDGHDGYYELFFKKNKKTK